MHRQKHLWIKLATIVGLVAFLQIPLLIVESAMQERKRYHQAAAHDIARSWSGSQKVTGPFLVVPYQTRSSYRVWDNNLENYVSKTRVETQHRFLVPSLVEIQGDAKVEYRARGIYRTPVYFSELHFSASLDLDQIEKIKKLPNFEKMGSPHVVVFLSDLRGVSDIPELKYGGSVAKFAEGTLLDGGYSGIHSVVDLTNSDTTALSFSLLLKGSNSLGFYPTGKTNRVSLSSTWPHPKFRGRFLPDSRRISDSGFDVSWSINSLSSNLGELMSQCQQGRCESLLQSEFGVDFFEPVSRYTLADRAGKYAILFLLTTFSAFFLFEIFKKLLIHPLQYMFVGLALSVFYLLLVALSEHILFSMAYSVSAGACIGLIGIYTSYMLRSVRRATLLSFSLIVVYGIMFVILYSEDFAFLMGALLLFALLAALMVLTRKVDWYSLSGQAGQSDVD